MRTDLYRLLFPEKVQAADLAGQTLPDWEKVRKELKKSAMSPCCVSCGRSYRETYPNGYTTANIASCITGVQKLDPPMRQNHKAGEKLFVDYAGNHSIVDLTGEVRQASVFVPFWGQELHTPKHRQARRCRIGLAGMCGRLPSIGWCDTDIVRQPQAGRERVPVGTIQISTRLTSGWLSIMGWR